MISYRLPGLFVSKGQRKTQNQHQAENIAEKLGPLGDQAVATVYIFGETQHHITHSTAFYHLFVSVVTSSSLYDFIT